MMTNLFYGGDLEEKSFTKSGAYYWVSSKLVRESGPWDRPDELNSPGKVYELIKTNLDMENCDKEYFVAIYLDRRNKINAISTISIGDLNSTIVHPREVFKPALLANAANIIITHNHPSGDPTPSPEDIKVTERLIEAGEILGIKLIDYIIIGDGSYVSLKAKGHI